jgi:predicted ATP-dependent endonuclease of OLD family
MKLARISLKNFRCYQEQTAFDINELTLLIGRNDAGKSAILDALNIFFEEAKIDAGDGSIQGDKKDIRIICEFDDLPEEIDVDAGFKTTLKDEYLLNEKFMMVRLKPRSLQELLLMPFIQVQMIGVIF